MKVKKIFLNRNKEIKSIRKIIILLIGEVFVVHLSIIVKETDKSAKLIKLSSKKHHHSLNGENLEA